MIGQHMGLSEDVENMVSKKVIRDVRFKNMPVIHWGSKFWEFPMWGLQSSKQNRVQMNGVLMSKCRRPMRLFLVPINLAATMMAPQQQYTVISGCRSLSYQRRLHFLFGWSTACHNVCSGRLFPICIWRAQFSLSELPQEIPNFHSMFHHLSLLPGPVLPEQKHGVGSCHISGVIQYSNTPKYRYYRGIPTLQCSNIFQYSKKQKITESSNPRWSQVFFRPKIMASHRGPGTRPCLDRTVLDAGITACGKAEQWRMALHLLRQFLGVSRWEAANHHENYHLVIYIT